MNQTDESVTVVVLGTAQDGGYPHTGCLEECCLEAWDDPKLKRQVSSLAILSGKDCFLIDITPDIKYQLKIIEKIINDNAKISGIFISHAHIGHYIGLLELGLEVMNTHDVPVYVMPRMRSFLIGNAPFVQLVELKNISLNTIKENMPIQVNSNVRITPFQVPHRNEFSETVGYKIQSILKSVLYISDIDSWNEWDININELIEDNDISFLDGTFYDKTELNNRDLSTIPYPSIRESMEQFSALDKMNRKKVNFTHLNHTNNVLRANSDERKDVIKQGFQIAFDGMKISI